MTQTPMFSCCGKLGNFLLRFFRLSAVDNPPGIFGVLLYHGAVLESTKDLSGVPRWDFLFSVMGPSISVALSMCPLTSSGNRGIASALISISVPGLGNALREKPNKYDLT